MNCREALDFLDAYVESRLDDSVRAEFERHLAECPDCVAYLANYRATISAAKAACGGSVAPADHLLPEDLVRAMMSARTRGPSDG